MSQDKIKSTLELLQALEACRKADQRVVTTNGCFDVLHVGHLRYLQAARETGDLLVVLLNSDDSVKRLKGPSRPIVPEAERAEMLAGLACVDFVTVFSDDTPMATLEQIRPDIHVKGADYSAETLPEAKLLESLGTQLAFIPMVEGRSTTNLIQRIRESYQTVS
jgi:rfaE bifunctional protein nucleotidyltransferase chain/domain